MRLGDNELYSDLFCDDAAGVKGVETVTSVSLFVFDSKFFQPQPSLVGTSEDAYQTIWCGPHAAQALIEAVNSLREDIKSIGGELLVRTGDPSIIVPQIAEEVGATEIIYNEEPGWYENTVAQKLKEHYAYQYGDSKVKLVSKSGYTLYHPDDLPFDPNEWDRLAHPKKKHSKKKERRNISNINLRRKDACNDHLDVVDVSPERFKGICRIMGDFRKASRSASVVRLPIEGPDLLMKPDLSSLREQEGSIPTLEDLIKPLSAAAVKNNILGLNRDTIAFVVESAIANRNNKIAEGHKPFGERTAAQRLNDFIDLGYAATADRSKADVSNNNSSRFSSHLALGTLSPRLIYWKVHEAGDEARWIMSHLEMRDFFLYTTYAAGNRIFRQEGLPVSKKLASVAWTDPQDETERWDRWATGKTQLPLVDAAMKELMSTGYCSNRVRQNVASVLTKDLQIDWRAGAEWFQLLLEDHCVGANFGNWVYFSGVGPDPKTRHFRTVSQLKRYDPKGEYIKKWLTALNFEESESIFRPWDHDIDGFDSPIVDPKTQYTWQDLQFLEQNGTLL